jgi:hypothetical protein
MQTAKGARKSGYFCISMQKYPQAQQAPSKLTTMKLWMHEEFKK